MDSSNITNTKLHAHCLLVALLLINSFSSAQDPPGESPKTLDPNIVPALERIGTWDGKTASAALEGPYEDRLQQEIPFGRRSFYLSPWRSYMDTWPAARFSNVLAINCNSQVSDVEAVAEALGKAGITAVRSEFGWGNFSYEHPGKFSDGGKKFNAYMAAFKKHGLRPLILLNANAGEPVPKRLFRLKLTRDVNNGALEVFFENGDGILPGYSGFFNLADRLQGFPFITKFDPKTGRAELSGPLPKPLKAGSVDMVTLKYQPFAGSVFADGTPNPAAAETLEGWKSYVAAIATYAKAALGTEGAADAGFDVEVWNELTFGSEFLSDKNYYNPARKYKEPLVFERDGFKCEGQDTMVPVTVEWFDDPRNQTPGVRVINGLTNQSPWGNGVDTWPGQEGYSRHYYTTYDANEKRIIAPSRERSNSGPIHALGLPDGKPNGVDWDTVEPGSFFVPIHIAQNPEYHHFGYKTEFMTRDLQPFPGPMKDHYRFGNPGTGHQVEVWQTEVNTDRVLWATSLTEKTGVGKDDPRFDDLMHRIGTKTLLRTMVFKSGKGMGPQYIWATSYDTSMFGVIPDAFFKALKANDYKSTPEIQALAGPQLEILSRLSKLMKPGMPMVQARPLSVEKLVEHQPRLVFAGDGTPAHPDRFNRDDFACLPYQLDAGNFAVGYYVVTRNMVHEWDRTKDVFDATRYDMPPQRFDLTLGNVRGSGAKVSVYDPMTDQVLPASIVSSTATTLTVSLPTTDAPRFLMIEESKPGPLVLTPQLMMTGNSAQLSFATNLEVPAKVSWGVLPERTKGGSKTFPAANQFTIDIENLPANTGVQVTLESDGLKAMWPRWGYDVAGVGRFTRPVPKNGETESGALGNWRVPPIPTTPRASSYSAKLPQDLEWTNAGAAQALLIGAGPSKVDVTLQTLKFSPDEMLQALPEASTLDKVEIVRSDWKGMPAWLADFSFNAPAHPGLVQLRQRFHLVPVENQLLVMSFKSTDEGFATHARIITEIIEGLRFDAE